MSVRFGLALDFGRPDDASGLLHEQALALVRLAESVGFESVWAGESYPLTPVRSHLPSPLLALASLAGQTRMTLGTGVVLLPAWHPLRLAYDVAVLDRLTQGRFILGVGVGRPDLAWRFGVDPTRVGDFADDTLAALRAFWMGAPAFQGRMLSLTGPLHPLPHTLGGPPIWVGGTVRRSAERAARLGDAWYAGTNHSWDMVLRQIERYRTALTDQGKDARTATIAVNRLALVAENEAEAQAQAAAYLAPTLAAYAARSGVERESLSGGADAHPSRPMLDASTYLVGTSASVTATLRQYAAAGVTHVQIRPFPEGVPFEVARRTVERIGKRVMPLLAGRLLTDGPSCCQRGLDGGH